ncbi:MAG: dipeptide epimerase [Aestuariivita sp.]|nr:dipeptide epimerase [Aestuariivita sp.]
MINVRRDVFKLKQPFSISRGLRDKAEVLTVEISRHGLVGRGECTPYLRYGETFDSVAAQIAAIPNDVSRDKLQRILKPGAARNAVDCALWDLEAKLCNKRVWELAGLAEPKPRMSVFTLSLSSKEKMQSDAHEYAHCPVLKIKLGTPEDLPRLEAVRRGAPDAQIIVDANEGWTASAYSELLPHLVRLGVKMIEQPVPANSDEILAKIDRIIPVCADESCHDTETLSKLSGKYDMVNIKLDKTGGLTEALKLKREAVSLGFDIMVGCMLGSSLAIAPAILLAQDAKTVDLDAPLLLLEDRAHSLIFDEYGVHPSTQELWG